MLVTDRAKRRIEWINSNYDQSVRLAVHGGGCAGFSYEFDMSEATVDDVVIDAIVIDPTSFDILRNATVDFVSDFHGNYFKVDIPDALSNCGCGKSFSI